MNPWLTYTGTAPAGPILGRMDYVQGTGQLVATTEGIIVPDPANYCGFSHLWKRDWHTGGRAVDLTTVSAYGYSYGNSNENPFFHVYGGRVSVSNLVNAPIAPNVLMGFNSGGYAPYQGSAGTLIYYVNSQNGGDRVDVEPANGRLYRQSGAAGWLNLGSIEYPAMTGFESAPTLLNGWANYLNTYAAAMIYKHGDVVTISGLIRSGTQYSTIMTLPDGWRPPGALLFPVAGSGPRSTCRGLAVYPSGNVVELSPGAGDGGYLSLCGISYSVTP
jgi:hypothetical protein